MIPLCVTLEGFLSYQEPQRLEFDDSPLWVLAGPNGAGKSAIFDAITFALYDHHRAGGQNAGDLINHHWGRLVVEFDFLLSGASYRVRRTARKQGRSVHTTREAFRLLPSDAGGPPHPQPIADTTTDAGFNRWVQQQIGLNYKAFTSSVLLLQGQSDRLLRATTADRYQILAELIDLTPYQALHSQVDDRRRWWEGRVKSLTTQLAATPPVSDGDLEAARGAVQQAEEQWKSLQTKSDRLAALLGQARQWEGLEQERTRLQEKLGAAAALLERAQEISHGHARWQELARIVPQLRNIVNQRGRLEEQTALTDRLRTKVAESEEQLTAAEAERARAQSDAERHAQEIRQQHAEQTRVATRMAENGPLVARLEQFEELQSRLEKNADARASLPADLGALMKQAEERNRWLEEAGRARPWLEALASARGNLSHARDDERSAASHLETVKARLTACREDRESAAAAAKTVGSEENRLSHAVTRAQTTLNEICGRRDRFATVAGDKTCSFCGQSIDERHAKRERKLLADQVAAATCELQDLRTAHQTAADDLQHWENEIQALDQEIASLTQEVSQWEKRRGVAQATSKQCSAQIRDAFQNLPPSFQARIAPQLPADEAGWRDTVYPTATDLASLKQGLDERPSVGKQLSDLRDQQRQWLHLDAERQALLGQQSDIQGSLDLSAARAAREEEVSLKRSREQLETDLQTSHAAHGEAIQALERAEAAVKYRETKNTASVTGAAEAQATCDEIGRSLAAAIAELPQDWREKAAALGADELAQEESTLTRLAPYVELWRQVDAARGAKDELEKRTGELTAQIVALPEEARCPSEAVVAELDQTRTERDEADTARRKAEQFHADLDGQRQRQQQCEARIRDADRRRHLHDRLSNLLGPRGLQLALLRRAERGIVDLANETLSAISRGRMELALRGGDGLADSQSGKALDLVVYNHDTGTRPMLALLASGSQAFRIAVSLALAIGRYAGQEARRVESVIIDEGFGSLDKNGRDDMIQELHQLEQDLKRIILVSHQDEFAGAFANGYSVKLSPEGASRVSLLECG